MGMSFSQLSASGSQWLRSGSEAPWNSEFGCWERAACGQGLL